MEKDLGRTEAERGDGLAQPTKALSSPPRLPGDGRPRPDNLKGRKSQTLVLFFGGIVVFLFFFFKFLLVFCLLANSV